MQTSKSTSYGCSIMSFFEDGEPEVTSKLIKDAKTAVIFGTGGLGKTTIVSKLPSAFCISIEAGCEETTGMDRFIKNGRVKVPATSAEFFEVFKWCIKKKKKYKNIVIDSGTELEKLFCKQVLSSNGKVSSNDGSNAKVDPVSISDYGYGAGQEKVCLLWNKVLNYCKAAKANGQNVIILCHEKQRNRMTKDGDEYKKSEIDLCYFGMHSAGDLLFNRSDVVIRLASDAEVEQVKVGMAGTKNVAQAGGGKSISATLIGGHGYLSKVRSPDISKIKAKYIIRYGDDNAIIELFEHAGLI